MAVEPMGDADREQRALEDQETLALMGEIHAVCRVHCDNAALAVAALCSVAAQYLQHAPPGERMALVGDVTNQMTSYVARTLQ